MARRPNDSSDGARRSVTLGPSFERHDMSLTLRQLEVFLALAEHEHVGRAAEMVHLSPSATSSALLALETAVGRPLFDRSGLGLRLNADGRRFRAAARATLEQAREATALLRDDGGGRLVIGASTTIANYVIAPALATFAVDYPAAELRLDIGNTREIRDRLLDYALDLAYVEGPTSHPDLRATPWRDDRLVVFVAPNHPLAASRRLDGDDARTATWVLREEGSGTREVFVRALGDEVVRLTSVLEVASSVAVARAVEAGFGIGCLSSLVVRRDLDAGRLVELQTPNWDLRRTLWRLERRDSAPGRLAESFAALLASDEGPVSA